MRIHGFWVGAAALVLGTFLAGQATAGTLNCPDASSCGVVVQINGATVATETFVIAADGSVSLAAPVSYTDGVVGVYVDSVGGNVDPELSFAVSATNNSGGPVAYSFAFSLPLGGLATPLATSSQLGTTLTAASGGTLSAQLAPTSGVGFIVDSQDIRFGSPSVDKGVDIGDAFSAAPGTTQVRVEGPKVGSITSGGPFDLMAVTVSFALTDPAGNNGGTAVGLSGNVRQVPVPEPAAFAALGMALVALALQRRRAAA
jgi:hypothetical protein